MLVHVFAEIENDGDVATLAGETGARAARQDGRSVFAARRDGGDYVGVIARDDEADGNVAVVRGVGGVEGAGAGVEADFAAHGAPQLAFESGGVRKGIHGLGVGTGRQRKWGRQSVFLGRRGARSDCARNI